MSFLVNISDSHNISIIQSETVKLKTRYEVRKVIFPHNYLGLIETICGYS